MEKGGREGRRGLKSSELKMSVGTAIREDGGCPRDSWEAQETEERRRMQKGYGVPSTNPHTCTYTHKHTHIHTHSHTHKCTHPHPHTHTHTHAYDPGLPDLPACILHMGLPWLVSLVCLFNLGPALKGPSRKAEGEQWGKQLFKGKLVVRKEPRLTAQRDTAAWEASKTLQEASLPFCPAPPPPLWRPPRPPSCPLSPVGGGHP